jgi:hypothetical protein
MPGEQECVPVDTVHYFPHPNFTAPDIQSADFICVDRGTRTKICSSSDRCPVPGLLAVYYPFAGDTLANLSAYLPVRDNVTNCVPETILIQVQRLLVV